MEYIRDIRPDWFKNLGTSASIELWDELLNKFNTVEKASAWLFKSEDIDSQAKPVDLIKDGQVRELLGLIP